MKRIFIISAIISCLICSCKTHTIAENEYVSRYVHEHISEQCDFLYSNGYYNEYVDKNTNIVYAVTVNRDGRMFIKKK